MIIPLERYKLTGKPFEISLLNYEMAGREQEWGQFLRRLESAFQGNECKFIVIQGKYGLGKSYTMERLYDLFKKKRRLFRDVFLVNTILAERPIRAHPGEPAKTKFGLDLVNRVFQNIEFEELMRITKKIKKGLSNRSLKIGELVYKVFLKIKEGDRIAYDVLCGTEVSGSEVRAAGLKTIRDSQTALGVLFDFQKILKAAGYNNFLILLDEFEYIPTLSTPKVTVILDTFRNVFDQYGLSESRESGKTAKIVFVFAVSPGGWERIKELEASAIKRTGGGGFAPFMDRVNPIDIISLNPLNPKETVDLIAYRLKKHMAKRVKISQSLYPFTKECIEFVAEASQGVPRDALRFCGILLEDAAEKGKEKITLEYAKKVLKELNLYVEPKAKK